MDTVEFTSARIFGSARRRRTSRSWPRSCSRTSSTPPRPRPAGRRPGVGSAGAQRPDPSEIDRYRGREIATTGDGFLAVFDGAARAVRVPRPMIDRRPARSGSRSGPASTRARSAVAGGERARLAVHAAARVAALGGSRARSWSAGRPGDLLDGSGLTLEDRGASRAQGPLPGLRRATCSSGPESATGRAPARRPSISRA